MSPALTAEVIEFAGKFRSASEPIANIGDDERGSVSVNNMLGREIREGTALCLSGGGYRAMLFHAGVLWRLNDAGRMRALDRVSSVSGGSLTAGVLAQQWENLRFEENGVASNFAERVVGPLRRLAHRSIDVRIVLIGRLPFKHAGDQLALAYRKHVFADFTLQDLPLRPNFVFTATNLESGGLMRFSKPYLGDYRIGRVPNPSLSLALVIAASSAAPPLMSPCTVDIDPAAWITDPTNDLTDDSYRAQIHLVDGGIYDNLALETVWKQYRTLFVSDGARLPEPTSHPEPGWIPQLARLTTMVDNQIRALRKQQVLAAFLNHSREGMYIGIRSRVGDYGLQDPIPADPRMTSELAAIPSRLAAIDDLRQELLINWGYAICDAALRNFDGSASPGCLPYPDSPLV